MNKYKIDMELLLFIRDKINHLLYEKIFFKGKKADDITPEAIDHIKSGTVFFPPHNHPLQGIVNDL